jgi:hypothetical protein
MIEVDAANVRDLGETQPGQLFLCVSRLAIRGKQRARQRAISQPEQGDGKILTHLQNGTDPMFLSKTTQVIPIFC